MTQEDLIQTGIIVDGKISDVELGLLLLKYNKIILKDGNLEFEKLCDKVKSGYDFSGNEDPKKQRKFLMNCLAICEKPIQLAFIKSENNTQAILKVHNLAVESIKNVAPEKENIRAARSLAEEADALRIRSQKYKEGRDQYEYLLSCLTNEEVFDVFYKRLEGRLGKDEAKQMINQRFPESQEIFLKKQDKYFDFLTKYFVKEDSRLLSFSERDIG